MTNFPVCPLNVNGSQPSGLSHHGHTFLQVFSATSNSVSLSWIPSFGHGTTSVDSVCDMCQHDGSLVQYASTATSPNPSKGSANWAPHQATGPPGTVFFISLEKTSRPFFRKNSVYGFSPGKKIEGNFFYFPSLKQSSWSPHIINQQWLIP